MKLPISFLLYTTSLGLAGFTGWQVYELLPLQKREAKDEAMTRGQKGALDRLTAGKGKGVMSVDWRYTQGNRNWWEDFKRANFIGKPPEVEKPPEDKIVEEKPPEKPIVPLEDIFELATLVYDGRDGGKGELSHALIRYKPDSPVTPPEWYERQRLATASSGFRGPRDGVPPPRLGGNQKFQAKNRAKTRQQPMPTTTTSSEPMLQMLWIKGGDDIRKDPHLWPPFEHIRLVRIDESAQSAYFIREAPPPKEGEDPVEPKEEQLFKSAANLSQEVLRELFRLYGEDVTKQAPQPQQERSNKWVDTAETQLINGVHNIGREDEKRFQTEDDLFEKVYFDVYRSKRSDLRGLQVTNVDPQLAAKFGVTRGDVLISVNNRSVKTKAQALQFGKKEYRKGVRTFVTVWLSGGQEVERIYQMPDK